MVGLFWLIVLLILILTGAIVPVVIFGAWALVVVLVIVFLGLIILKAFGLLIEPFAWLATTIASASGAQRPEVPRPSDPDYPAYIAWANGKGEYGRYERW